MTGSKFLALLILAAVFLISWSSVGFAATTAAVPTKPSATTPVKIPDPTTNPVLATVLESGAKLYYLGHDNNMDGWFIIKDGRVQMIYSTPDNKGAIIGAIYGPHGENITAMQVKNLTDNNKEVGDLVNGAIKDQSSLAQPGGSSTPVAPIANSNGMPSVAVSPGEELMQELATAASTTVGNGPLIMMVMNPNCSHCQATWKSLRDIVFKNALQIRLIPLAMPGSEDERASAILLHVADPLNAWDKYVAGDKTQLAGTPDAASIAAVHSNHVLTDKWNIFETPYIVYRGKDGKVKIIKGEPEQAGLLIGDLAP